MSGWRPFTLTAVTGSAFSRLRPLDASRTVGNSGAQHPNPPAAEISLPRRTSAAPSVCVCVRDRARTHPVCSRCPEDEGLGVCQVNRVVCLHVSSPSELRSESSRSPNSASESVVLTPPNPNSSRFSPTFSLGCSVRRESVGCLRNRN